MDHSPAFLTLTACFAIAGLPGCPSSPKPDPSTTSAASAAAVAAPSAAPSTAASADAPARPVCKMSNQRVWGTGPNKLTGLTTRGVGENRVAVGFAYGLTPHLLVVNKGGGGQVLKVQTAPGSKLSAPPKGADGFRQLLRVTPASVEGDTARAMVDFRDEYKDKRRVVACGRADVAESAMSYDGTSFLDLTDKPVGEERKKLFSSKLSGLAGYVELRDCRSFFSRKSDESWVIGSVLHGVEKEDSVAWKAALIVDQGSKARSQVIHAVGLKDDPPKGGIQFEVPSATRVPDKGFVVAARYGGSLLVALLDNQRKLTGAVKSYPGMPLLPDLARTDTHVILTTAVSIGPARFGLRTLMVPTETMTLPAGLSPVRVNDEKEGNETDPELVVDSKGQRWLAYIEGERDKGHLEILPLDAEMKRAGRPYFVTEDKERASEARVVAMDDGDLLVVYIRDLQGKLELVTEELSCSVVSDR